jgi:hypothetical protein
MRGSILRLLMVIVVTMAAAGCGGTERVKSRPAPHPHARRRGTHRPRPLSRDQAEAAARESCTISKADGLVGMMFEGVGARGYCSRWVRQEGKSGEYWGKQFAGPNPQACDLELGSLQALVYYSPQDSSEAVSICARLVGAGWTDVAG